MKSNPVLFSLLSAIILLANSAIAKTPNIVGFLVDDLEKDPGEQKDLTSEKPELVKEMRGRQHEWYIEADAGFLQEGCE